MVLNDLNLRSLMEKKVALLGGSGFGKLTLIYLLQRFYNPIGGAIFVDGVGVEKLQLKWLRSYIGPVNQELMLFATSIKENILFENEDATMEEVVEAAQASNAHNFISQFPEGYETQVGEPGVQLSGGQKQRIAIARAIIKRLRILLLDKATSVLDSESERIVQEALDRAAVGRTTIIIAHRLSTIRNADIIAVFQNGQVIEMGSHDELIQAILGCTGAVLYGAVQPVFAFLLGTLVSVYFVKNHKLIKEKTRIYALCFVGLAPFSLVTNVILHYHFAYMGELLTKRIREMMLSKFSLLKLGGLIKMNNLAVPFVRDCPQMPTWCDSWLVRE